MFSDVLPPLRIALLAPLAAAGLMAGCGGSASVKSKATASAGQPNCPTAWRAAWQRLANEIDAPVFCPSWMPAPLDARIGGTYANGRYVDKDRSYLVSFVSIERDVGGISGEVHVNFRGYPGRTAIPVCEDTITENGVTRRPKIPCFDDARWTRPIGPVRVTAYTANQGVDQWHVLYAWRQGGTLYSLSEHVAPPYTYAQVVQNMNRMMRGLALVRPAR
jgi:hypothetical protein